MIQQGDALLAIRRAVKIANLFLQDVADDYFYYPNAIQDEWEIMRLCGEYDRASAKAEIARDIPNKISESLTDLLKDQLP